MDGLRFANSKEIREHLRKIGYQFSSLEVAGPILAGLERAEHVKLWLDDVREVPEGYTHCKSVNEAKKIITGWEKVGAVIDVIDCDHDLGDYANDGGDGIALIDWLVERQTFYPIELHTMNPVGRENMQREIDRYWGKENKASN